LEREVPRWRGGVKVEGWVARWRGGWQCGGVVSRWRGSGKVEGWATNLGVGDLEGPKYVWCGEGLLLEVAVGHGRLTGKPVRG